MSVYFVRNKERLNDLLGRTIKGIWGDADVGQITNVGNHLRLAFIANNKKCTLDIYQNINGTTTFTPTGKNTEITRELIKELEKNSYMDTGATKTVSLKLGVEWNKKAIDFLDAIVNQDESGSHSVKENKPNVIHTFISPIGDKLVLTECPDGKMLLQGKPLLLYNELLPFISESPQLEIEAIVQTTKEFVNEKVKSPDAAREKMKNMMPRAYGSGIVDETIWKVFSPSIALLGIEGKMEDYSCCMFPALRALEGYLLFLLDEIGEVVDKHKIIGNIFREDSTNPGHFIMSKKEAIRKVNLKGNAYKLALEEVYTYFAKHRHVSFHMNQIFIDTKLIEDKEEAEDTVNEVAELIEKTFILTHP